MMKLLVSSLSIISAVNASAALTISEPGTAKINWEEFKDNESSKNAYARTGDKLSEDTPTHAGDKQSGKMLIYQCDAY